MCKQLADEEASLAQNRKTSNAAYQNDLVVMLHSNGLEMPNAEEAHASFSDGKLVGPHVHPVGRATAEPVVMRDSLALAQPSWVGPHVHPHWACNCGARHVATVASA